MIINYSNKNPPVGIPNENSRENDVGP